MLLDDKFINVCDRLPSQPGWYKVKVSDGFTSDAPFVRTSSGKLVWVVPDASRITHWREFTEEEKQHQI